MYFLDSLFLTFSILKIIKDENEGMCSLQGKSECTDLRTIKCNMNIFKEKEKQKIIIY